MQLEGTGPVRVSRWKHGFPGTICGLLPGSSRSLPEEIASGKKQVTATLSSLVQIVKKKNAERDVVNQTTTAGNQRYLKTATLRAKLLILATHWQSSMLQRKQH